MDFPGWKFMFPIIPTSRENPVIQVQYKAGLKV